MDSLKISKSSSSSSSTNNASSSASSSTTTSTNKPNTTGQTSSTQTSVPITVRFNAADECIDDIFQTYHTTNSTNTSVSNTGSSSGGGTTCVGGDSLSSSPSQHHQNPINNADRIREHGYPAESHFVETSDGYVINLFRIPYSPKLNNENVKKPVIFLQHGLFSCSDCFLLSGPDNAIAYNFADKGYDVWLGNGRGNIYSRNNTKISLNHPYFWSFSWHEIGYIDIPEMIDYILNETGESKLHYAGHSQGVTVFFVMASLRPEYNDKIKTAHMFAPPIFMGNVSSFLVVNLAPYVGTPGLGADILGDQQFVPENTFVQRLLDTACGGTTVYPEYCNTLFLLWNDNDLTNFNMPEEVNTRNFLQSNFFNRKRSGSIEGISPTTVGPNLIAALSSSDTTSIGTWRLIKGKVSQTIEDIKSSKGSTTNITTLQPQSYPTIIIKGGEQAAQSVGFEYDSDQETKTSLSEDLSIDQQDRRSSGGSSKHKRSSKLEDSDSEFENELLLEGDLEHSRLRRGLASLKSKVKAKHAAHQAQKASLSTHTTAAAPAGSHAAVAAIKKDTSPSRSTGSSSSSTSAKGHFLRRRRNKIVETGELASPTNMTSALMAATGEMAAVVPVIVSEKPDKKSKGIAEGKKIVEIESGVEMLEDMIPPPAPTIVGEDEGSPDALTTKRDELDLPLTTVTTHSSGQYKDYTLKSIKMLYECNDPDNISPYNSPLLDTATISKLDTNKNEHSYMEYLREMIKQAKYLPYLSILGLLLIFVLPLNDFIRGVLACLLGITIVEGLWTFTQKIIEHFTISFRPEKITFHIPDYSKITICEVPAVKEHKTVKSYSGWMNEIDSYDPNTFSVNLTRSVYIKLDGSVLHISTTNARIPKRVMWNELPINRKTIIFTTHRSYDLTGCRIELLPIGLARKRHFNRKYPIQLIIKECKNIPNDDDPEPKPSKHTRFSRHRNKHETLENKEQKENKDNSNNKPNESETQTQEPAGEMDFGATILNADLQKLQDDVNPDEHLNTITVPCGDEVRILLFARCAREKEDWYRRFVNASTGDVHDQDLHLTNVKLINSKDLQAAATKAAQSITNPKPKDTPKDNVSISGKSSLTELQRESTNSLNFEDLAEIIPTPTVPDKDETEKEPDDESVDFMPEDAESIEGLLMMASAARNDADYIKFMSLYQNACTQSKIPVYKGQIIHNPQDKKSNKRTKRNENELWKGIDQSLFLGPSGSVVWANVLVGRLLYSSLQNEPILEKIQDILQKKLNSIKLPGFMEDVVIKNINLGTTPPLIHRCSQPMLDERGIWLDMDMTYEGHCHITVTTKMNLLRLKKPMRPFANLDVTVPSPQITTTLKDELLASDKRGGGINDDELFIESALSGSAIFDSDAESTGSSSTESDSPIAGTMGENPNSVSESTTNPGNARRIFKFVDRIATSNFFQSATELSFVQKAMENMSTTITLGIDLRGLVSRVTINIPPPPSDRIWLAFRAPPRLWLTARPTVGDKSFDWSIVTNVIEGKLCEAVNKYLVYPNMVDLTVPFMGKSAASES